MKAILRYSKAFIILIAAFFAFAVLSCLLPYKGIRAHIGKSASSFDSETVYPKAIINLRQCQMDNFTDGLIMNINYNVDAHHPVRSAMAANRSVEYGNDWNQPGLVLRIVEGEQLKTNHYSRYWHGNSFLFRFFFLFWDFNTIRWVLYIISSLLFVMLLCAYYLRAGLVKTLVLSSGFLATCGFVTQFSMQFFPVLALTLIGCLIVIKRDESKPLGMLFFVIGALTCYFDLLTTPLLTLGMPLVVMLSLNQDDSFDLKRNLFLIIQLALLWGLGFALTFFAKWVLATLILGQDVLANAYAVAKYRVNAEDFTRWDAVSKNFNMLQLWMIVVAMAVLLVRLVIRRHAFEGKKALLLLLVGLMPYVWYFVLSNHSYEHWWFTYRLQTISVVSLLMILMGKEKKPLKS
jgi:hypothetical protein